MADMELPEIEALSDLLDREREALLAGDLDGLARMADAKEALVARVAQLAEGPPGLERLRRIAERNGDLLSAAMQGIRAAMARLKQIADGPGPLVTYDGAGKRKTLDAAASQVTRRA